MENIQRIRGGKNRMFRKIMSLFINKKTGPEDRTEIFCHGPVTPSKQAIALTEYFKNDENNTFGPVGPVNFDDLYCRFADYLKAYSEGDVLPKTSQIENDLQITNKKRRELYAKAQDESIILKSMRGNKVIYKYNINLEE